jgi:hypothetical protein
MSTKALRLLPQLLFICGAAFCQQVPDKSEKKQIDINTATEREIAALPQVGNELAKKIVSNRPYASIEDLARAGVPKSTRDLIAPRIKVSRTQNEAPQNEGGRIARGPTPQDPSKIAVVRTSQHGVEDIVPRPAAAPKPLPAAAPQPPPATFPATLPPTATSVPLIGFVGLFSMIAFFLTRPRKRS